VTCELHEGHQTADFFALEQARQNKMPERGLSASRGAYQLLHLKSPRAISETPKVEKAALFVARVEKE
jgi:hypothetical protein